MLKFKRKFRRLKVNSTLPTQWAVKQPQQLEVSSQGVMSSEKASYNPGLIPIKGQKFDPGTWTGPRDQFLSLP